MESIRNVKVRQLVDWKAALIAGLAGGLISFTANIIFSSWLLNSPWLLINQLVQMKFSPEDEIAADTFGVDLMSQANYDRSQMISVMKILEGSTSAAPIEFLSTHPSPENRIGRIQAAITEKYPDGVPSGMIQ